MPRSKSGRKSIGQDLTAVEKAAAAVARHGKARAKADKLRALGYKTDDIERDPYYTVRRSDVLEQQAMGRKPVTRLKPGARHFAQVQWSEPVVLAIVRHANSVSCNKFKFTVSEFYKYIAMKYWFQSQCFSALGSGAGSAFDKCPFEGKLGRDRWHQYHNQCLLGPAIIEGMFSSQMRELVYPGSECAYDERKVVYRGPAQHIIMKGGDPCLWTSEATTRLPGSVAGYTFHLKPRIKSRPLDRITFWREAVGSWPQSYVSNIVWTMDTHYCTHDTLVAMAKDGVHFMAHLHPSWHSAVRDMLMPMVKNNGDHAVVPNHTLGENGAEGAFQFIVAATRDPSFPTGKKRVALATNVLRVQKKETRLKNRGFQPFILYREWYHGCDVFNWHLTDKKLLFSRRGGEMAVFDTVAVGTVQINGWSWCRYRGVDGEEDLNDCLRHYAGVLDKRNAAKTDQESSSKSKRRFIEESSSQSSKVSWDSTSDTEATSDIQPSAEETDNSGSKSVERDATDRDEYYQHLLCSSYALMSSAIRLEGRPTGTASKTCTCTDCVQAQEERTELVRRFYSEMRSTDDIHEQMASRERIHAQELVDVQEELEALLEAHTTVAQELADLKAGLRRREGEITRLNSQLRTKSRLYDTACKKITKLENAAPKQTKKRVKGETK